jgi:uroporphyrinogen-III synthase
MKGKTIAILETRVQEQMADLVRRHGGHPFSAPALAELPDLDPDAIAALVRDWVREAPALFIFQTGVGTRALFALTDQLGLTEDLLEVLSRARVAVRGPKPTGALRSRKVRIDFSAEDPFTTHEVLAQIQALDVAGKRVVVQRYGEANRELRDALEHRGALVSEIATYRWGLPEDIDPLLKLIDALERDEIDLVAFTSASQASNLFTVARNSGRAATLQQGLSRTRIASIGPVCSAALSALGVRVDVEASPPKLGAFLAGIDRCLSTGT